MKTVTFIHIGKTGGTSIRAFLRAAIKQTRDFDILELDRHSTAQHLHDEYGEVFDNSFKFSVVREPFARYASACRQCKVDPNAEDTISRTISGEGMTGVRHNIFVRQVDSLLVDGKLCTNNLFRFETDLGQTFIDAMAAQGIHWHQIHNLNTKVKPVTELSPTTIDFVREFYKDDFETFGYETHPENM